MNVEALLFTIAAAATLGGALVTALSERIFRAALGLFLSLGGVAGIFFVLGAPLLAALQMILYAGGVLVLFLFAIFVTPAAEGAQLRAKRWQAVAATLFAALVGGVLLAGVAWHAWPAPVGPGGVATADVGTAFVGEYLIPFEAISILLLAAMVAAVFLIRKETEE